MNIPEIKKTVYEYKPPEIIKPDIIYELDPGRVLVVGVKNPFKFNDPDYRIIKAVPVKNGIGIKEYVNEIFPIINDKMWDLEAAINGKRITKQEHETTRIESGDYIVICLIPHGSDGGKSIWRIILSIVIIIISIITYQYYGIYWALAVSVIGNLAVNYAFQSTPPDMTGGGASEVEDQSSTYAWSTRSNTGQEGKPLPVLYGTLRIMPYFIARHITAEGQDGKQYLHILMLVADHAIDTMTELLVNDNPIENYEEIDIVYRYGTVSQNVIEYFGDTYTVKTVGMTIDKDEPRGDPGEWSQTQTNGNVVEGLIVGIVFPRGLTQFNDKGNPENLTVKLKLQYKTDQAESWTDWTGTGFTDGEVEVTGKETEAKRVNWRIDNLSPNIYDIRLRYEETPNHSTRYLKDCQFEYIEEIIYDDFRYPGLSLCALRALATDQISGGMPRLSLLASRNTIPIYDSDDQQMVSDGNCRLNEPTANDIELTAFDCEVTHLIDDDVVHGGCLKLLGDATATEAGVYFPDGSDCGLTATEDYDVSVDVYIPSGQGITGVYLKWKNNAGSDTTIDSDTTPTEDEWITLSGSFTDDDAQQFLWVEFAAADTDTLYIHADNFSCREDGTTEGWHDKDATNPAWICYDMLVNDVYGTGISYENMIFEDFKAWAQFCDDEGFIANMYFDSVSTLPKSMEYIQMVGRGFVVQKGSYFSCVYEGIADPVQMFSMGNIIQKTFKETFLNQQDRANCVEVTYFDKNLRYSRQTIELRTEEFNTGEAIIPVKASTTLYACNDRQLALRHAKFALNCNKYIERTIEFEADVDAIACQVSDIILFSHDIPQWGISSRIYADGCAEDDTELVTNPDCEAALPTIGAVSCTADNCALSQSSVQAHGGTDSMLMTGSGAHLNMYSYFANPVLTDAKLYKVSVWIYNPSGQAQTITYAKLRSRDADNNITEIAVTSVEDAWTNLYGYMLFDAGASQRTFEVVAQSDVSINGLLLYIDDYSLIIPPQVTVDKDITLQNGITHQMIVRHQASDTLETQTMATVMQDMLFEAMTPVPIESDWTTVPLAPGLFAFGLVNYVSKKFRIMEISRGQELNRKIKAIEYLEIIYDDSVELTSWESPEVESLVTNLQVHELWSPANGGQGFLMLTWLGTALTYHVWQRVYPNSAWTYAGEVSDNYWYKYDSLHIGTTYEFTVCNIYDPGLVDYVSIEFTSEPEDLAVPEDFLATYSATDLGIRLSWTLVGDAQIYAYDLAINDGVTDTIIQTGYAGSEYLWHSLPEVGAYTFKVRSRNAIGSVSEWASFGFTVVGASAPATITPTVIDNNVLLAWTVPIAGTYGIDHYEIKKSVTSEGKTWSTATSLGITSATFTHDFCTEGETYTYWIAAVDIGGNEGTPASVIILVDEPPGFVLLNRHTLDFDQETVGDEKVTDGGCESGAPTMDSTALTAVNCTAAQDAAQHYAGSYSLKMTGNATSTSMEIYFPDGSDCGLLEGHDYTTSVRIYLPSGQGITNVQLYYRDSDANDTELDSTTTTDSWVELTGTLPDDDADRVLYIKVSAADTDTLYIYIDSFSCQESTSTNCYIRDDGTMVAPIDIEETWTEHFVDNSNSTLQDFIDDGYTYMPEPVPATAAYQETVDEGLELSTARVQTTYTKEDFNSGPAVTRYIAEKQYGDNAWNEETTIEHFFYEFQFLRTRFAIASDDGKKFGLFSNHTIDLNQTSKTESGTDTTPSSPTPNVTITLTGTFYDINSIQVTPIGTTALFAVVDFTDAPNPTEFDVYIFNDGGTAQFDTDFTWHVTGI